MFKVFTFITALILPFSAFSFEVRTQIQEGPIDPFDPLNGTINILHGASEKIDVDSFILEGQKLQVKFLKDEKQPDDQILSTYSFAITPEKEGLSALSPISVKVGDKRGESPAITYTVQYKTPDTGLRLRAFIHGEEPFYPGKRLKFVYKIYYRGNVKLTKEDLPLLKAEGFTKIGELDVKDSKFKGYSVSTITQEVETLAPGSYSFGTSTLEGLINNDEKIQTTVEPFTVKVVPFPTEKKPATFTGGIGNFTVKSRLLSTPKVMIGDIILLEIEFTGKGNLDRIELPNITCEPGLYGFFAPTQTPPYATIKKNSKKFTVELVPLSALVQKIPALHFSTFNPESQKYEVISSRPIPLSITPQPLPTLKRPPLKKAPPVNWDQIAVQPENLPLQPAIEKGIVSEIGLSRFYFLMIIAVFLLIIIYFGKEPLTRYFYREKQKTPLSSLKKALQYDVHDRKFYWYMKEAFRDDTRLKARQFLDYLDEVRFGGLESTKKAIYKRAREALS
ncbi:MAG: hypothetical protein K940chlam3_00474 [Chlamydiae bacterium]|nr:hypothetical protein [Chlamydiota bacterium]